MRTKIRSAVVALAVWLGLSGMVHAATYQFVFTTESGEFRSHFVRLSIDLDSIVSQDLYLRFACCFDVNPLSVKLEYSEDGQYYWPNYRGEENNWMTLRTSRAGRIQDLLLVMAGDPSDRVYTRTEYRMRFPGTYDRLFGSWKEDFALAPVPLPASVFLLLPLLGAVSLVGWRRSRAIN